MLSQKMAGGNMLRLIQGMSNLNVYSMPWNISQRCIGQKTVYERLMNVTGRPKRPANAYFEFKTEVEPEVKRKNPDLNVKERARIVAQLWKECPDAKKEKYKEVARKNYLEYKEVVEKLERSFSPNQRAEIEGLKNDLKRLKDERQIRAEKQRRLAELDKPKKPMNPFIRFIKAQGFPTVTTRQFMKDMAHKWANMSENQKKPYIQEYEKDCEQFKRKLEAWESKMISLGHLDLVRSKTLKEKVDEK